MITTIKFIKTCHDAGYTSIGIHRRDKIVPNSLGFPESFDSCSVYAYPNARINDWPAIWAICKDFGFWTGCGNSHQCQIKADSLASGVYRINKYVPNGAPFYEKLTFKRTTWVRPEFCKYDIIYAHEVLSDLMDINGFVEWVNPSLMFDLDDKEFIKMLLVNKHWYILKSDEFLLCRFTDEFKTVISFK